MFGARNPEAPGFNLYGKGGAARSQDLATIKTFHRAEMGREPRAGPAKLRERAPEGEGAPLGCHTGRVEGTEWIPHG